jgi:protein phosphatase
MNTLPTPIVPLEEAPRPARRRFSGWRGGLFAGAWSEVGTYHPNNEDSFRHAPGPRSPRFCAVADGVGGGSHGDLASAVLLDHCAGAPRDTVRDKPALSLWAAAGDEVVRARVAERGDKPGASTLVAVWFLNAGLVRIVARVVHVGDCRLYHLIPGAAGLWIEPVTEDQTYANLGLTPPSSGSGDDPARMVGVGAVGTPPVADVPLAEGEALLLCSDGLHKFLAPEAIARLVDEGLAATLPEGEICRQLVAAAKAAGSYDDVTALLVVRRPWLGLHFRWRLALLGAILLAAALQMLVA